MRNSQPAGGPLSGNAPRILGLLLALLVFSMAVAPARADHGEWQDRRVWVEPVLEERTRTTSGRWVNRRVWVPPRTVTREETTTVAIEVQYQVLVPAGHWDLVQVRVEAYQTRCELVWRWYRDCSDFWRPCTRAYGPREECKKIDVSYFRLERRWIDTSYWETRTRTENRQRTRTVAETVPGYWETRRRWQPGRTETYWHQVQPGRWETRTTWVELPHGKPGPEPDTCRPHGIYKVARHYVGNTQWTDKDGTIHYRTKTSRSANPWWAVSLGSASKGSRSRYDSLAFNGRGRGADGLLLAGRFYRNYLPDGDCFDPVSVVFFQDDTVISGDLDQPVPDAPVRDPAPVTPSPKPDPVATPTAVPGIPGRTPTAQPDPAGVPARRPTTSPGPSADTPVSLVPDGNFAFAVAIEGTGAITGSGQPSIQVLRGAPVEVYLLPRLEPPGPETAVSFLSWSFRSGRNDHPRAPSAGVEHGPLQPLRLRLDARPPAGSAQHQIGLTARIRVVGEDGRAEIFDLPVTLLAAVQYQAIA